MSSDILKVPTGETIKQIFKTELHEIIKILSLANTIDVYFVPTHHYFRKIYFTNINNQL